MAFGKPKAPKEPKPPKAPKEKKPKKPKKEKPPKEKKGKKGKNVPEEAEGQEGEQPKKKKLPLPFLIISLVVIVAAAVILFLFVIKPRFFGEPDPEVSVSVEPEPPVLPSEIPIGDDVSIAGLQLGSDESEALAEKAKTITYRYTNLVDAGKAAQTYAGQLAGEDPRFSVVDEEFVIQREKPDYTAAEGMVLLARNVPVEAPEATDPPETESPEGEESQDPDASAEPTPTPTPEPEPEPTEEPITYVHTVRITWSPGLCVVTADEQVGKVTSPPSSSVSAQHPVTQRGAVQQLEKMTPAQLGLPGESMDIYEVIPMDATETVDGIPCIRMHVFNDDNAAQSNDFVGSYLLSIDAEHLYRVDPITDEITELEYEYVP